MSKPKNVLGRLERVDLKDAWDSEALDFTPWLASEDNLPILGDTLHMDLELEGQERSVGIFRADILCKNTDDGSWVLIENQLERTNHKHLGQILTYAAGLHAVTICWIAERFAEEHRATMDWLNEISDEKFQFFGLEIELWKIGDSAVAPKFNIVSRPNDWRRSVTTEPTPDPSPTKKMQQRFWEKLKDQLEHAKSSVRPRKPLPQHWMDFSLGRSGIHLQAWLNSMEKKIGVALTLNISSAKKAFKTLEDDKESIEEKVGLGALEWHELPERKSSKIQLAWNADPTKESKWPEQVEWMRKTLESFDKTFRPMVKSL